MKYEFEHLKDELVKRQETQKRLMMFLSTHTNRSFSESSKALSTLCVYGLQNSCYVTNNHELFTYAEKIVQLPPTSS